MFGSPDIESLFATVEDYLSFRLGGVTYGPIETSILIVALAAALVSLLHLWRIGQREERQDVLEPLRGATPDLAQSPPPRRERWYQRLGATIAASPIIGIAEQHRLLEVLARAGIKGHGDLATFIASKVCGAVVLSGLLWLFLQWAQWLTGLWIIRLALLLAALMVGWRLPDILLSRLAAWRRQRLEQGMPDALDLLVICAEAGLSLDQAIEEVSRDIRPSNHVVADEFATTAAEMRVLPRRADALENLVRRTRLASLSAVTTTLSQAIRFGTPLAESMRVVAAEMRTTRLARIEERAARLPVLLAIPLALFILPSLFIVIATPVIIQVIDTMRQVFFK
jgi:tight adherence protein C